MTRRHDPSDHDCRGGVLGDRYPLNGVELGQCLNHGYVTERCCILFEPRRVKPFLQPALDKVMPEFRAKVRKRLGELK